MESNWFKANVENANYVYASEKNANFFERDRNRIIYSQAFRRLGGKTQIFINGFNDNLRNRLTHTIEVCNIAKIIGKDLDLNLELIEAIALGHDIGHTPFGHMGERTINFILNGCININNANLDFPDGYKGYKHNFQGVRILTSLAVETVDHLGLDISDYTLWGILNHTSIKNKSCEYLNDKVCYKDYNGIICSNDLLKFDFYKKINEKIFTSSSWTIEALVVQIADEIAQRFHDVEDAVKAKILKPEDIICEFDRIFSNDLREKDKARFEKLDQFNEKLFIPSFRHLFLNLLVDEICDNSVENLKKLASDYSIMGNVDFIKYKEQIMSEEIKFEENGKLIKKDRVELLINYSKEFAALENKFHEFLKKNILQSFITQSMDNKGDFIIKRLFEAFSSYPEQLPDYNVYSFFRNLDMDFDYLKNKDYKKWNSNTLRSEIKSLLNSDKKKEVRGALFRTIGDHISSMTDSYACKQYENLYGIKN